MKTDGKLRHILVELRGHIPFTAFGALLGILFMMGFRYLGAGGGTALFRVFHPAHVVLSAMVTASMFRLHAKRGVLVVLVVGYLGSVGIATLSDIIIPHIGASVLGLDIPTHSQIHSAVDAAADAPTDAEHHHDRQKLHLGFIEEWYLVNPAALIGILIALFYPRTKFSHSGHVLISTWASSSYLLMSLRADLSVGVVAGIALTLFIATWVPCCISDIVFPLLFVEPDLSLAGACPDHRLHSHPHKSLSG